MKNTILPLTIKILAALTSLTFCTDSVESFAFVGTSRTPHLTTAATTTTTTTSLNLSSSSPSDSESELSKPPTFNGQLILPVKIVLNGLQNHKVAAVYAIQPNRTNGYAAVTHISITKDLKADLESLISYMDEGKGNGKGSKQIGFVRALSFAYPQKTAMEEVMQRWISMVIGEGGSLGFLDEDEEGEEVVTPQGSERTEAEKEELVKLMLDTADYDSDDEDEFEYDDEDGSPPSALFVDKTQSQTQTDAPPQTDASEAEAEEEVTSPFEIPTYASTASEESKLEFNLSTVDKVLDEIRPYLISDGGNVSVHSVNEETRSVYLVLEGACGSCASSTVTMQLGIERVLKENFDNIGEVAQVELEMLEGGEGGDPDELTMEAVMKEVNRIAPAITAMGGNMEVLSVDPVGVVEVRFRGANKVQQGVELALLDVKYVKHVKFVN